MREEDFEKVIASVRTENTSCLKQLDNLYYSKGDFTGEQAVQILQAYRRSCDKMTAMQILETRMAPITCCEAKFILLTIPFPRQRLKALKHLLRAIVDFKDNPRGQAAILEAFPFEADQQEACRLMQVVMGRVRDTPAAGGHCIYGAVGSLYVLAPPLNPHHHGSVESQMAQRPGKGTLNLPCTVKPLPPRLYDASESFAYPPEPGYTQVNCYPGRGGYPRDPPQVYPAGAPPLTSFEGAPHSMELPQQRHS